MATDTRLASKTCNPLRVSANTLGRCVDVAEAQRVRAERGAQWRWPRAEGC